MAKNKKNKMVEIDVTGECEFCGHVQFLRKEKMLEVLSLLTSGELIKSKDCLRCREMSEKYEMVSYLRDVIEKATSKLQEDIDNLKVKLDRVGDAFKNYSSSWD